ncbi:hypothetical protein CONPUDRAFT_166199 [Coniophora puteana RWD-64-598 SS2]|uniref:Uncharacterized protein n=1 Tax=Coniophora puteana (strain RWD-64-598) TaxID=741705 RepID=A0A5M3MP32_CONPW|nr:uncharacterized protein CONPUDRAFT_166199 [Coniophora puteana RWD-64-598 SS2]EIW80790.1 hypothetical protein CONPUDRAFT_166199 [Coniophora puteana RWD-64-598 SS2]
MPTLEKRLKGDESSRKYSYLDVISGASCIDKAFTPMRQWLWNRFSTLRPTLPLTQLGGVPSEYSLYTCFVWDDSWDCPGAEMAIPSILRGLWEELLTIKATFCSHIHPEPITGCSAADVHLNLEYIVATCQQARLQSEVASRYGTPIACAHIWDSLVRTLTIGESLNTLNSPSIALPRNALSDRFAEHDWRLLAKFTIQQSGECGVRYFDAIAALHPSEIAQNQALDAAASLLHLGLSDNRRDEVEALMSLAKSDPVDAVCDVVVAVSVPGFVERGMSLALYHAARSFSLLQRSPSVIAARSSTAFYHGMCDLTSDHPQLAFTFDVFSANICSAGVSPEATESLAYETLFSCPKPTDRPTVPDSRLERANVSSPPDLPPLDIACDDADVSDMVDGLALEIPLLLVNHTPPERILSAVGSHKHRMSATATAAYYAALGLSGVPLFSLVTNGCRGVITCAWAEVYGGFQVGHYHINILVSSVDLALHIHFPLIAVPQRIKIVERNAMVFDLTNPLSALHLATVLVRLKHEHGKILRERFDEQALTRLRERLEHGEWETRWTMAHYIEEHANQ